MEGTIDGFIHGVPGTNDSWEYKFNHHPGGSDPVRRIEIYRLPKGAKLVSTDPANMLRREIDGRIELAHVEMIPGGGSILTQFIYKLPKKASPAEKTQSERLSAEGWKLWLANNFKDAETQFQKSLELNPENTASLNGLGWSQMNQGMPESTKAAFEKCIAINPKFSGALNGLGYIAKNEGKNDEAIQYWERAVKASPNATASLAGLARTYMDLQQYDKAVKYYRQWTDAEPKNQEAKDGLEKAKALRKSTTTSTTQLR
jgi:tetratricopeptide (TPR) repeat protein